MKKAIVISLIVIFLFFNCFIINSNASFIDDILNTGKEWLNNSKEIISIDVIINTIIPIGQMLTAIGASVLFGAIIILGIKYIISSPEQKGKLKQQLIGLVISGIVIFAAYTIWKTFYDFFTELFN